MHIGPGVTKPPCCLVIALQVGRLIAGLLGSMGAHMEQCNDMKMIRLDATGQMSAHGASVVLVMLATAAVMPFLSASPTLPPGGGGGACLPVSNWWVPPSHATHGEMGQEWVGGFEGKGDIPCAEGAGTAYFEVSFIVDHMTVSCQHEVTGAGPGQVLTPRDGAGGGLYRPQNGCTEQWVLWAPEIWF